MRTLMKSALERMQGAELKVLLQEARQAAGAQRAAGSPAIRGTTLVADTRRMTNGAERWMAINSRQMGLSSEPALGSRVELGVRDRFTHIY
jgi:hypothetical protein